MDIILNFIPLKQGGGVQVGLDFLNQAKLFGEEHNWHVVTTEGTPFIDYEYGKNIFLSKVIPNNLTARLLFEYFGCKSLIKETKASIIYTQFGPVWPGTKVMNVAGCAYSNLMYPEIDFWGKLPFLSKVKRKIIDYFRLQRMLATDYLIYETQDLAERAIDIYDISEDRVGFVRPSVSSLVNVEVESVAHHASNLPKGFKVLLLSHYRVHKNIELLPLVANKLKKEHGIENVIFVLTLSEDKNLANIMRVADKLEVERNIFNIGPVEYNSCGELYSLCDVVILPSLLESFSNTIAEAWAMKKPLLISDLDWAHSICEDAAIYFNYADVNDLALKISDLVNNRSKINDLIENGTKVLNKYSDSKSRFLQYKKILEDVVIFKE